MALRIHSTRRTSPQIPQAPQTDAALVARVTALEEAVNEISDRVDAILNALKEEFDLEIEQDAT